MNKWSYGWSYPLQTQLPFNSLLLLRWAGSRTLRNINPIYNPHSLQIPHKHSQPSLPGLPFHLYGVILGRTRGTLLRETLRTRGQEPMLNSKLSYAPQGNFVSYALPAATLPISGLWKLLRTCWLTYPKANNIQAVYHCLQVSTRSSSSYLTEMCVPVAASTGRRCLVFVQQHVEIWRCPERER